MSEELITSKDKEVFEQVGAIAEELRTRAFNNSSFKPIAWYRERLDKLTGCFMFLSERFGQLKSAKNLNSINAYIQAKLDYKAANEKFSNAAGEKEAEHVKVT